MDRSRVAAALGAAFVFACLVLVASAAGSSDGNGRLPVTAPGLKGSPPVSGPNQSGPVQQAPTGGTDRLVNNNAGAAATANFTQSETSQVVFGNTAVVGFNDSGSNAGGTNKFTGWSRSTDGGQTWTDGGTLPTNAAGDAGDPQLARDAVSGRIYFATLGFSNDDVIQLFHSDDNGQTWSAPVNAAPGRQSLDKHWLSVDNFPGSGQGNVYLVVRDFAAGNGIYLFRSTDHGATWGPSGGILIASGGAGNVQGANVVVGPDHSVYALWYDSVTSSIKVRKSTDLGQTFAAAVSVATGLVGGTNGDLGLTGTPNGAGTSGFRSNEFPQAAVNPSNGDIYVTFDNNPAGTDKADVFLVQSTDGGATWSAATKVNDDATTTDQWGPTLAVMPDGSALGVFYYSRQEDTVTNNLFKFYGRIGTVSGHVVSFGTSFPVSDVASLPEFGRDSVVNSVYMGDYDVAVATAVGFHVTWADNRDDLSGGAPRKDPNVYADTILAPGGTITVTKHLISNSLDPAKFNLRIDGTTYAANVGDGGTTGAVSVASGTHTVSETAGTNANLSNYTARIACSDGSAGYGTSLSGITVNNGDNVTCTITNTRKLFKTG